MHRCIECGDIVAKPVTRLQVCGWCLLGEVGVGVLVLLFAALTVVWGLLW